MIQKEIIMAKKTVKEEIAIEEVTPTIEEVIRKSLVDNCLVLLTEIKNGNNEVLNKDHVYEITYNDCKDEYTLHVGSTEQGKGVIYLSNNLHFLPAHIVGFSIMYDISTIDETISYIEDNKSTCFSIFTPDSVDQNFEVSQE